MKRIFAAEPGAKRRLTRRDAAARLGLSVRQIRYLQQKGRLPGRRDSESVWTFAVEDVDALAETSGQSQDAGELAAQVYERFRDGDSDVDVVIALRLHPDDVAALRARFVGGGGAHLNSAQLSALRKALASVGMSDEVADLVESVTELCERELQRMALDLENAARAK